ncbi:alpha/beta-hydrolase [Sistotremastrum niveocremeum HHB9708]|uniref:Alpha/beta-hydrolase n=1 Tax=Sistotremastrum niveocremeum HHB9708 TaxID=1314777 RepID=A0A164YM34_9AGAM|nr:alpha/beta-hydrolase [Sistotremastrum niveocremeum HHB9708]
MSSFDIYQQTFLLTFVVEALQDTKAPLAVLQAEAQSMMPKLISNWGVGPWKIVWGPTVWKHTLEHDPKTGPDNTWFIARSNVLGQDTYVLAIAGSASTYDYIHDDFGIDSVVDFNAFVASYTVPPTTTPRDKVNDNGTAYVAYGTASASYTLLNVPAPVGAASAGLNIVQFLSTVSPSSQIVSAGHSLGAALAPTVAMVLKKAKQWNNLTVYATAGPTPGNGQFANQYYLAFPFIRPGPQPWQCWNKNICNSNDVVPQAWCTTAASNLKLANIVTIYQSAPALLRAVLEGIVAVAKALLVLSEISYAPIANVIFTSDDFVVPTTRAELDHMVGVQHHDAYFDFMKLPPSVSVKAIHALAAEHGLTVKTERERIADLPVFGLLKIFEQ